MSKRTPTEYQEVLLRLAKKDGGVVRLTGLDRRPWMNRRTLNAAYWLEAYGYGMVKSVVVGFTAEQAFAIHKAGLDYLKGRPAPHPRMAKYLTNA